MTSLTKILKEIESTPPRDPAEVLALALAEMAEQSVDGICPYWQICHADWGHVSDEYRCAWRQQHRVMWCGTYRRRQREGA